MESLSAIGARRLALFGGIFVVILAAGISGGCQPDETGATSSASAARDALRERRCYTVTELIPRGAQESVGSRLNQRGQVIGVAISASGSARAFVWERGTFTDLGTLGGSGSSPIDINERGDIVGGSSLPGDSGAHAFLWRHGVMTDLGTLGGNDSLALDVNDRGQVVGWSSTADGTTHAFLWERGAMIDLGTLGGYFSTAVAINERGQVAGSAQLAPDGVNGYVEHAFLWERGEMLDLGALGQRSYVRDINAAGEVIGYSEAPGGIRPFLWRRGTMLDLGTLGGRYGYATAINDRGQVAGDSARADGYQAAFLWERGEMHGEMRAEMRGEMIDITAPRNGWSRDINERGQVVGGYIPEVSYSYRPYVWSAGVFTDLPTGDRAFGEALDINDHGQIVGTIFDVHQSVITQRAAFWVPSACGR